MVKPGYITVLLDGEYITDKSGYIINNEYQLISETNASINIEEIGTKQTIMNQTNLQLVIDSIGKLSKKIHNLEKIISTTSFEQIEISFLTKLKDDIENQLLLTLLQK